MPTSHFHEILATAGATTSPFSGRAPAAELKDHSISEIREIFGVTARALYHYEEKGLISPYRRGERRYYSARDYRRLEVIVRARKAGLALAQIVQLFEVYGPGRNAGAQIAKAQEFLRARLERIDAERQKVLEATAALDEDFRRLSGTWNDC